MLPNQPILLTPFGDGDSEDTIRCTLIHQVINQLPIPGNQRSFQILMQSPFPTRHNIPSLTTSRTLQRLFQVRIEFWSLFYPPDSRFCLTQNPPSFVSSFYLSSPLSSPFCLTFLSPPIHASTFLSYLSLASQLDFEHRSESSLLLTFSIPLHR
ncbi:uncharacterized protein [Gossypium hirsutum]|uniref:Uncharacterized protein isoform X6 n=1 Tax=Gossypium hirsutum TaxID=3635 RepID=A0ABM3ADB1_GOSHI|nr:uncharacterized protein LOC107954601 isoform X6 [Gossypium hirsutum]